jgi:hypothetical protein
MGNSEKEMIITILPTIQGCSSYFARVCVNSTTDVKTLISRASIMVLPLVWCQIFGCRFIWTVVRKNKFPFFWYTVYSNNIKNKSFMIVINPIHDHHKDSPLSKKSWGNNRVKLKESLYFCSSLQSKENKNNIAK